MPHFNAHVGTCNTSDDSTYDGGIAPSQCTANQCTSAGTHHTAQYRITGLGLCDGNQGTQA